MSDVAFAGIARQAEMVRAGDVTPTELVELYLDRIDRLDPELNAYRVVLADRAREDAKRVEARLATGEGDEMPLAGVPIAVKDTEDLEGEVTTWGTNGFDEPAKADGEMVRRLRAAGAIVLGKTNLPELAICGFTETEAWGITRNPWDTVADARRVERRLRRGDGRRPLRRARPRPTAAARSASRRRSAASSA